MPPNPKRKEDPSLSDVIDLHIDAKLQNLHTAMPGKIVSYDFSKNLAKIQPLIKRKYRDQPSATNLPIITNVPVMHPRMGKASVRLPIKTGDNGLIIFMERSLDSWIDDGNAVDPLDDRKHSISDAVFYPGMESTKNPMAIPANKNSLTVLNDKMMVELKPGGKIKIKNLTTGAEVLSLFDELITALQAEPFVFNKAALTKVQVALKTLIG